MNREQILAKIKDLMAKQQGLVDKAKAENNRVMTAEEITEFNASQTEIQSLKDQLKVLDDMEANVRFMDSPATPAVIPPVMGTQGEILDDGGFENLGEIAHCLRFGDTRGRLQNLATGDVGILIPERFSQDILKLDDEDEIVMPLATNIPAGDPPDAPFTIPYLQQGDDGALGGIELVWTGEGKTVADVNDPKFKDLTLTPQEVSGMATINNKTLQNWRASGSFIQTLLRMAYVNGRDYKFMLGSGVAALSGLIRLLEQ
jgi:HK97 family phage major capsid protein